VALAACIMIFEFLPPLFPNRTGRNANRTNTTRRTVQPLSSLESKPRVQDEPAFPKSSFSQARFVFAITCFLSLAGVFVLIRGFPSVDPTANALRPRNSPAYQAMDEIKKELNQNREPFWVIVGGKTETEVGAKLDRIQTALGRAESNNLITGFTLPTALWPRPEYQAVNWPGALQLVSERDLFRAVALSNIFNESALGLSGQMLDAWERAAHSKGVFWPSNNLVQWIFEKATARSTNHFFAMGLINPMTITGPEGQRRLAALESDLPREEVWLSGWELLGSAIFSRVKSNMWFVLTPMVGLVFISLLLAFRRPGEVLLSLGVLALSALSLLTIMRLFGWSWNLLNLMALPLILGTGVDYSIFMQLALRRHHGDLQLAYRSVGRALLLCGGTACAGFGSLAFSTNAGMGSLGRICAVGIAFNMIISIFLLPSWWAAIQDLGKSEKTRRSSSHYSPDTNEEKA
jgi:predicted RND superfamily exporter protein